MDTDIWYNSDIKETLNNFVFAKIDFDANKSLASYGINSISNILIVDPNGKVLENQVGYMNLDQTNVFQILMA